MGDFITEYKYASHRTA